MTEASAAPQSTCFLGLLKSCLELTMANAKVDEKDPLVQWFQESIYVEDYIDLYFPDEIAAMKYDLILLSGTPGSGKTQFIKKLKRKLTQEKGFALIRDAERVQEFQKGDKLLIVKHDATQVDAEADNASKKLGELLAADWNDKNFEERKKNKAFLIGINKGILQRLFSLDGFRKLSDAVAANNDSRILVVDLALRSVVLPNKRKDSFVTKLLNQICHERFWEQPPSSSSAFAYATCHNCDAGKNNLCPILANVQQLRCEQNQNRMNELFEMSYFRGGQVITYRDVLAILAKTISGYHSYYENAEFPCDAIRKLAGDEKGGGCLSLYKLLFFNSAFDDKDIWSEWAERTENNLIPGYQRGAFSGYCGPYFERCNQQTGTMAYLDPAHSTSPYFRKLDDSVFNDLCGYLQTLQPINSLEEVVFQQVIKKIQEYGEFDLDENESIERKQRNINKIESREWLLFCMIRIARRRSSFIGAESIYKLTDYYHADSFISTVANLVKKDCAAVGPMAGDAVKGISNLGGCRSGDKLRVSFSESEEDVKSEIVLEASGEFVLCKKINIPEFIEYYPNLLTLKLSVSDSGRAFAEINVDLDIWECLMRSADGYLKDFLGVSAPTNLAGFIDGLRAKIWAQPGAHLVIRDEKKKIEIRKYVDSLKLR